MTTERLNEFAVLASLLNFSKAAEKLYITQSILSRHIIDMEKELGTTLFLRDTHGVSLTDEGKYFLREIQPLLKKTDDALSLLHENRFQADGRVKLTASEQVLNTPVMDFLRHFQNRYEDIHLDLHPISSATSREKILQSDIFLTPCDISALMPDTVECAFLTTQTAHIAFPPHHRFGSLQAASLSDLRDETLLVPFADELFGPYAQNALLADRKNHGHITRVAVKDARTAILMTELGYGVTIIPHHFKRTLYKSTRSIPVTDSECYFSIFCYLNGLRENPAAVLFYESIKNQFA